MEERPLECAQCKRRAHIIYKEVKNGRIDSCRMCSMCPILQTKIGVPVDCAIKEPSDPNNTQTCQSCQTCLTNLTIGETVRCSKCYEVFEEHLTKELSEIARTPIHLGKTPDLFKNEDATKKLDSLQSALTEALTIENYERAAALRDQIKTLSEQLYREGF